MLYRIVKWMHNNCDFAENSGKTKAFILKRIWYLLAVEPYKKVCQESRGRGDDPQIFSKIYCFSYTSASLYRGGLVLCKERRCPGPRCGAGVRTAGRACSGIGS